MKINDVEVTAKQFAFDGCHKIYLLDSDEQIKDAVATGYSIYPIKELKEAYKNSCGLRFISGWSPDFKSYVGQFEKAVFRGRFAS
jgi:hypothetical protein